MIVRWSRNDGDGGVAMVEFVRWWSGGRAIIVTVEQYWCGGCAMVMMML